MENKISLKKIPLIMYNNLQSLASGYWQWSLKNPPSRIPYKLAKEGAGSEKRTPLMHYGTVMPVYLSVILYLNQIGINKNMKLLELGCGTGRALAYLKHYFPDLEVYGVDYSESAIKYAVKNYASEGVKFKHAFGQKTDLQEGSFDFVISSHVIEHIPASEGKDFLAEVNRLIKNNGYGFIGTPQRKRCQDFYIPNPGDKKRFRLVPPHEHEYYADELNNLAKEVFCESKIDCLKNDVFSGIFLQSIKKFRPGENLGNKMLNLAYTSIRDFSPHPFFDFIGRTSTSLNMWKWGITYYDLLMGNVIQPINTDENKGDAADNLLLVCRK